MSASNQPMPVGRSQWVWRAVGACLGLVAYWQLYAPSVGQPLGLLYDILGVGITCASAGSVGGRLVSRVPRRGDGLRLTALLVVVGVAVGVQHAGWPFSGHLLCAWTAAMLEAGDRCNPAWYRVGVFVPGLTIVLIRSLWPQTERMAIHANTVSALLLATVIGAGALLLLRRVERGPSGE